MLTVLVALIAACVLWSSLYRATEALLQGVVGGTVLFWRLARWTVRTSWHLTDRAVQAAYRIDTATGQRVHAACYVWSFWLKRAYIASQLRARRRAARA